MTLTARERVRKVRCPPKFWLSDPVNPIRDKPWQEKNMFFWKNMSLLFVVSEFNTPSLFTSQTVRANVGFCLIYLFRTPTPEVVGHLKSKHFLLFQIWWSLRVSLNSTNQNFNLNCKDGHSLKSFKKFHTMFFFFNVHVLLSRCYVLCKWIHRVNG